MREAWMLADGARLAPAPGRLHTVELLEQALDAAKRCGYSIRHEWLGGNGGGPCEIRGQKWLFIDLALSYPEQLELALEAIDSSAESPSSFTAGVQVALAQRRSGR